MAAASAFQLFVDHLDFFLNIYSTRILYTITIDCNSKLLTIYFEFEVPKKKENVIVDFGNILKSFQLKVYELRFVYYDHLKHQIN